jgi:pyruvate dehydrogenase (quinone)
VSDATKLMQDVALYNEQVTGPEHAVIVGNRACRAALGDRGVAHLTISKDVQMMKRSPDKKSMRNPGARSSSFVDDWALCAAGRPASGQQTF